MNFRFSIRPKWENLINKSLPNNLNQIVMKNKIIVLSISILAMCLIVMLTNNCKKENQNLENLEIVNPKVKVATLEVDNKIVYISSSSDTIIFNGLVSDFEFDDIIVSKKNQGILRKVSKVLLQNGNTILITSAVSIADAFPNSEFSSNLDIVASDIEKIQYNVEGIKLKSKMEEGLVFEINDVVLWDDDKNPLTKDDQVTADGSLTLQLNPYLEWKTGNGKLNEVIFGCRPSGIIEITVNSKIRANFTEPLSKLAFTIYTRPQIVFIAGIPVVITNEIPIYIGIEGSTEAQITAGIKNATSLSAEIKFQDGTFSTNKNFQNNFELIPPAITGEMSLICFIEPKLVTKLYGVAGPNMKIRGYVEGIGTLSLGTNDVNLSAEIYGGIELSLGLTFEVFDFQLISYDSPALISYKIKLWEWSESLIKLIPVADFSASPTSISSGQGIQFTDQSTNSPTSWNWNFGDGSTSTFQNPSHSYLNVGNYTVTLTATNSYGSDSETKTNYITVSENTGSTVTDIDGNIYNTITIGTQIWMKENLKTTKYNDETAIPIETGNSAWSALSTPAYCWYNNDEATNKNTYGALYNNFAVGTNKLCPTGWHVPTNDDWTTLTTFLGGVNLAGGKMKEAGTIHWSNPNTGADNTSGFTALPGGYRFWGLGTFSNIGNSGNWWGVGVNLTNLNLQYNSGIATRSVNDDRDGVSVRCIKN
jgi:uncharacterized protein (TIGR02145 family)